MVSTTPSKLDQLALEASQMTDYRYEDAQKWLTQQQAANHSLIQSIQSFNFFVESHCEVSCQLTTTVTGERVMIVAFQSTSSPEDWDANMKIRLQPITASGIGVHVGFQNQYAPLHSKILKYLTDLNERYSHILITGFSQGGALAQICAQRLSQSAPSSIKSKIQAMVSFSAPKAGNTAFYAALTRSVRCRGQFVEYDIVPRMPSLPGYAHLPTLTWFSRSNDRLQNTPGPNCCCNIIQYIRCKSAWSDHDIDYLITRLWSAINPA